MKLKDKRLKSILADNWYRVIEKPVPTNAQVIVAVAEHNKGYLTDYEQRTQSGNGGQDRWWERHREPDRRLPIVYHPTATPKVEHDWTCPVQDVKGCPIAKEPIVEVPIEMYRAWTTLAQEFDTEWMAYLIGEVDAATGRGLITEMYFPPQSVSGAHVEQPDESFRVRPGTIAAVHSHVKMDAFFSVTDEDHANWPIEIVINARGESKMRMRVKLECGRYSRIDGKVMLTGLSAYQEYIDQLKAAIKPKETTTSTDSHGPYSYGMEGYN
jgi:hypothetical protein